MNNLLKDIKVDSYTLDPYSARVLILKLEDKHNLTIRVNETDRYCMICIDKEDKHEDE